MVWGITKTPVDFGASFVGALDSLPASAAAYSVARRLLTSYEGPLIRVRRSSDSTELDIGYDAAGDLDTAALLTFCGAGDGLRVTEYDQSGNARNRTQATAARQAKVVSSGVLCVDDAELPHALYDGTDDFDIHTFSVAIASPWTVCMVLQPDGTMVDFGTAFTASAIGTEFRKAGAAGHMQLISASSNVINDEAGLFVRRQATITQDATSTYLRRNGAAIGNHASRNTMPTVAVGNRSDGGALPYKGGFSEAIAFASELSVGDRAALEANQIAYYGITP